MVFNSITFLCFLAAMVVLYWMLPTRPRLWVLALGSLMFYGFWRVEYLPILLISACTDYFVSLRLARARSVSGRRALLAASLVVNLSFLVYFKYLLFFTTAACDLLNLLQFSVQAPELDILLPLGISFYTFQTISYTVDVYRGFIKPQRNFIAYLTYVSFFPQLVAGPILRASEVLPQLLRRPGFDVSQFGLGVRRIFYGLFLKCVLADNIAPLVNSAFQSDVALLGPLDVWTMAFLFGLQIYFDFSAYSHIALGCALLMGIRFPENFNFPYLATSPRDFWRRWHISLSSWIRDYLYLPLCRVPVQDRSTGGLAVATESRAKSSTERRTMTPRWGFALPLMLTWAIMGLWHGANWTFVCWGLYHATLILAYRLLAPGMKALGPRVRTIGGWVVTVPVMMLGWIFFRAQDLTTALTMYGKLFDVRGYGFLGLRENTYLVAALVVVAMLLLFPVRRALIEQARRHPMAASLGECFSLTAVVLLVAVFLRPIEQFIYFQF